MKKTLYCFCCLIISIYMTDIVSALPAKGFMQDAESLKESIIALDITRKKTQQHLLQLKLTQNMSLNKEIREYTMFSDYLSFQIINYCQQLANLIDHQALSDLPCTVAKHSTEYGGKKMEKKPLDTAEDQMVSLENELLNSLGDFDEMLLKEEEHIAQTSRKSTETNSANQGKSTQASQGGLTTAQRQETQNSDNKQSGGKGSHTETTETDSGKMPQSNNPGSVKGRQKTSAKNQSRERRKLDEIDDDIVARQLKEAAEKETDPQLKEKLWDEYYRYKKSMKKQ